MFNAERHNKLSGMVLFFFVFFLAVCFVLKDKIFNAHDAELNTTTTLIDPKEPALRTSHLGRVQNSLET